MTSLDPLPLEIRDAIAAFARIALENKAKLDDVEINPDNQQSTVTERLCSFPRLSLDKSHFSHLETRFGLDPVVAESAYLIHKELKKIKNNGRTLSEAIKLLSLRLDCPSLSSPSSSNSRKRTRDFRRQTDENIDSSNRSFDIVDTMPAKPGDHPPRQSEVESPLPASPSKRAKTSSYLHLPEPSTHLHFGVKRKHFEVDAIDENYEDFQSPSKRQIRAISEFSTFKDFDSPNSLSSFLLEKPKWDDFTNHFLGTILPHAPVINSNHDGEFSRKRRLDKDGIAKKSEGMVESPLNRQRSDSVV